MQLPVRFDPPHMDSLTVGIKILFVADPPSSNSKFRVTEFHEQVTNSK